jgi:putative ABC transport system permease protein
MKPTKLVFKNIIRNKTRFSFTLLGITIGIASLVTLLSLGSGLEREIKKQANLLGANLIVTPKGWCAYEQISVLTGEQLPEAIPIEDVDNISKIEGMTSIPYLTERSAIDNSPVPVVGILPLQMKEFKNWEVTKGEYLAEEDRKSAVVGYSLEKQFQLEIGDPITIRGREFTIKGILSETGSNDDIAIFIPLKVVQDIYETGEKVSYIAVRVDDITRIDQYILKIEETANVSVISDKQLLNSVLSITGTVGNTLRLIAAIAILAACFGIANTMTSAVYERKREIGILKAIGGKNRSIFGIFFLESITYGILGGLLGLVIGYAFSVIASPYLTQNEFTAFIRESNGIGVFDITILALETLAFSIIVSGISGLYAAYRASKLVPVEAISHG